MNYPLKDDFEGKYKLGSLLTQEQFDQIYYDVETWYRENEDCIIRNIKDAYACTGNEVGYSALTIDWKNRRNWKGVGDKPMYDDAYIRSCVEDKIYCTLARVYQSYNKTHCREGTVGLLIKFSVNIYVDCETISYDYNLSLDIGSGSHGVMRNA